MIFKINYNIEIEDINKNKQVTNKAIFKYLENSFCAHSENLNLGLEDIIKLGYTLVLLEWNLKVIKRPKYKDNIQISTWIQPSCEKYFYRNFKVEVNDEIYALARAKMMILNLKDFKPVKNDELLKKHYPEDIMFNFDNERLKEQKKYNNKIEFQIRKSDIDINNHVHNLNYLDMAKEIIDEDYEFDNITIEFRKQIKYKDKITIFSQFENGVYYIKVYNDTKLEIATLMEVSNANKKL